MWMDWVRMSVYGHNDWHLCSRRHELSHFMWDIWYNENCIVTVIELLNDWINLFCQKKIGYTPFHPAAIPLNWSLSYCQENTAEINAVTCYAYSIKPLGHYNYFLRKQVYDVVPLPYTKPNTPHTTLSLFLCCSHRAVYCDSCPAECRPQNQRGAEAWHEAETQSPGQYLHNTIGQGHKLTRWLFS